DIYVEGIRRISPMDFRYARQLEHTIRLICGAQQTPDGVILSVRPALIRISTILAGVQGAYNAVWVKGIYGQDTFYYGRGAGPLPTGAAVVSDLVRVARASPVWGVSVSVWAWRARYDRAVRSVCRRSRTSDWGSINPCRLPCSAGL